MNKQISRKLFLFLFLVSFIFCADSLFAETGCLNIHFIDVGEGDSILIETPEGKSVLIDCGNLISGFRVVEYLKKNNIQDLVCLILTHPHLDHIGGVFLILQMLRVEKIYDNGEDLVVVAKSSDTYRWYDDLVRMNKRYKALKAKDSISFGDVVLKTLWPEQPIESSDSNRNSIVIMLEYGRFRCLLTGDLTIASELKILEHKLNLKADVLKIGHHGAADATSEEFLNTVSPKIAIISVDSNNIRGYPDKKVINRLKNYVEKLYRTDKDGDIILTACEAQGKDFQVEINTSRK